MSEYYAKVSWARNPEEPFIDLKYSRAHAWAFDGGAIVEASPSPHVVPLPYSNESCVDPEEAFVASVSSCHMLFFLTIAAKRKLVVESYIDNAVGVMSKNEEGKMAMTKVTLRPEIVFANNEQLSVAKLEKMHHQSHDMCFIANSIKSEVVTEILD